MWFTLTWGGYSRIWGFYSGTNDMPFKFCYCQYTSVHSVLKLIIRLGFDSLEPCRRWTENHIKCPKHKALYKQPSPLAIWQLHRPREEKCPINTWCCFLYLLVPLPLPLLSAAMLQVPAHSDQQLSTSILDLMILGTGRHLMIVPEVSTHNQGLKGHILFPTLIPASSHIHTREISVFCTILTWGK